MRAYRMHKMASITLLLGLAFAATSCMSLATVSAPTQMSQFYDLPKDLDPNEVIHAVERSFAHVLLTAPRTMEGAIPNPLPVRPLQFTQHARAVYLDHLGSVLIPSVTCPQHLAVISAWPEHPDDRQSFYHYTACIQPYAEGYRVTIISNTPYAPHPFQSEPSGEDDTAPIARIANVLLTEIGSTQDHGVLGQEPGISHTGQDTFQVHHENVLLPERHAAALGPLNVPATLPLVCLAPKNHAAMLQSQPGGGRVLGTVEMGSVLAVAEPLDASYFKVETARGSAGWISRSEVTRLPCPVG